MGYILLIAAIALVGHTNVNARKWSHYVPVNKEHRIECISNTFCNGKCVYDNKTITWILPSGELVKNSWKQDNIEVTKDGALRITKMDISFNGLYHCEFNYTSENKTIQFIAKWGINVYGFTNMEEMMHWNSRTLVAFIAALISIILVLLLIGIYKLIDRTYHRVSVQNDEQAKRENLDMVETISEDAELNTITHRPAAREINSEPSENQSKKTEINSGMTPHEKQAKLNLAYPKILAVSQSDNDSSTNNEIKTEHGKQDNFGFEHEEQDSKSSIDVKAVANRKEETTQL